MIVAGIWLSGIAAVGALVAMIFIAVDKIRAGYGLDVFQTHWLVKDNWISFLLSVIVITLIVVLAVVIRWFQRRNEQREIQQLEGKYLESQFGKRNE